MALMTGRRNPSQNGYGWRETGMHGENWCHRPWSPIFSHEDVLGKARQANKPHIIATKLFCNNFTWDAVESCG